MEYIRACMHPDTQVCVFIPAVLATPAPGGTSAKAPSLAVAAEVTPSDSDWHKSELE